MPSIRQVAREAGVSIATVSRVLNGHQSVNRDLRQKVLRAADECNYQPTVGKRTADRVAWLYTGPFCTSSPYDSACLEGVVSAMRKSDYDLVILDLHRDRRPEESFEKFFARKGVCGAVVRSILEQRRLVVSMAEAGTPIVALGDHFEHPTLPFCYADSYAATREAVEHLVSLGHRAIAFASCERDDGDHLDRLAAYRAVLEEAGLYDPAHVYRVPPFRLDGAPLARRILSKQERPTAIFVADPLVAVGMLNGALELGARIPEDLSIVCVDDTDTRNMVYPRMTAVCQDSTLLGTQAFEVVCQLVAGLPIEETIGKRQQAWFEIHDTTGPPPSQVKSFLPTGRR